MISLPPCVYRKSTGYYINKTYHLVFIVNVFQREVLHIKEFLDLNEWKIKTSSGQIEILRHHWQSIGFLTLELNEFRGYNHSLAIQGHPKMKKSLSQIAELWRSILLSLWPCRASEYLTTILDLKLCFQRAKKRVKTLSIYLLTNSRNPQVQQLP